MKMKKLMARVLSFILAFALVTGMVSAKATYATGDNEDGLKEMARQFADKTKDPFAFQNVKKSSKTLKSGSLPAQFDLSAKFIKDGDETSYVTPVKFQNPFGSCWGFAAIAAAETSVLGDGLASGYAAQADEDNGVKELNLSEKHLINFIVTPLNDKTSPQNGEGMYFTKKNMKLTDKFDAGGLTIFATSLFASGMGPNREDRNVPDGVNSDIYEYKGADGQINQRKVEGKWTDYCYSEDDDWSMPEDLRFKQSYTLEESYILPDPAKNVSEDEFEPVYEYDPLATQAIKEQLMEKRAVEIGFTADTSKPDEDNEGEFISKNWAHYTDTMELGANHAVTIVGWDDNYSRENFVEGKQPPENMFPDGIHEGAKDGGNGAWLVKNSWGSGEESFPNKGTADWGIPVDKIKDGDPVLDSEGNPVKVGSGYFWLSYYDQSLDNPEALKFSSEVPTEGYYLDQHDYMPVTDIEAADLDEVVKMSNVFKAEANEQLEYISCQTSVPGTTVDYEIYLLSKDYKNPQDGIKVASGSTDPFKYGGFHKIKINDQVIIQKNQSYSIIVTQKTPTGEYNINIQTGTREEVAELFGDTIYQKGIVNKGESFVNYGGKWYDYSDEDFQNLVFSGFQYFFSIDNFPIKGYCKKMQDLNMYFVGENPIDLPPYDIEWGGATPITKTITLRFRKGSGAVMPEDPDIVWSVAPGSEDIFNMVIDDKDNSRCTVNALKPGTGYITVTCNGIGTQVIRVDVPKTGWYDVWDVGELEYGDSTDVFISNFDGSDLPYSTFKFSSDNKKVATVSSKGVVKAVGVGKTVIRATDSKGVEEVIKVKVIKTTQNLVATGKKVTVKADDIKTKSKTLKRSKIITVKKKVGTLTYTKKSGNKKITINKKTGKMTIKKGLKKGTYKVKVKVKAAGNTNYKSDTKTVTVTIKVK